MSQTRTSKKRRSSEYFDDVKQRRKNQEKKRTRNNLHSLQMNAPISKIIKILRQEEVYSDTKVQKQVRETLDMFSKKVLHCIFNNVSVFMPKGTVRLTVPVIKNTISAMDDYKDLSEESIEQAMTFIRDMEMDENTVFIDSEFTVNEESNQRQLGLTFKPSTVRNVMKNVGNGCYQLSKDSSLLLAIFMHNIIERILQLAMDLKVEYRDELLEKREKRGVEVKASIPMMVRVSDISEVIRYDSALKCIAEKINYDECQYNTKSDRTRVPKARVKNILKEKMREFGQQDDYRVSKQAIMYLCESLEKHAIRSLKEADKYVVACKRKTLLTRDLQNSLLHC